MTIPSVHFSRSQLMLCLGAVLLTVVSLYLMGRVWWCECGEFYLWSSEIQSRHNSQHLLDAYSWTHVLHGLGFYALAWVFFRHRSLAFRAVAALVAESSWEVLENTSFIIERYRQGTISLGYYGDSIANSLGDIGACALGFGLAAVVPVWASFMVFVGIEGALLLLIRDSLLLNILMLVWPLEAVREWQSAAISVPVGTAGGAPRVSGPGGA